MRSDPYDWRRRELNRIAADACALGVTVEACRVLLYRRQLQATIRWASPLLIDALPPAMVVQALHLLRPPGSWPESPLPSGLSDPLWRGVPATRKSDRPDRFMRRFLRHGVVLKQPRDDAGGMAVRIAGEDLEVGFTFGSSMMTSRRGSLRIEVPHVMPDTLGVGAVGRRIGDVLGHELLEDRDYRIVRVANGPDSTTFDVRTGRALYEMPWHDLVEGDL